MKIISSFLFAFMLSSAFAQNQTFSPNVTNIKFTRYTLETDKIIANKSIIVKPYENTLKIIMNETGRVRSGSEQTYSGTLHLLTGERPGTLLGRRFTYSIKNGTVNWNVSTSLKYKFSFKNLLTLFDYSATDNHIIVLPDKSLLSLKMGTTIRPLYNKPFWYNLKNMDAEFKDEPGQRGFTYILQSKDSGQSWNEVGRLDASAIIKGTDKNLSFDGTLGYPRNFDTITFAKYYIGGNDRPELYYEPINKRLYLSAWGSGGIRDFKLVPEEDAPKLRKIIVKAFTLYSEDLGNSWKVLSQDDGYFAPLVMTSTKDGTLFQAYQLYSGGPICIRYNTKETPDSFLNAIIVDSTYPGNNLRVDSMAYMTDKEWIPQITIARMGERKIRIAYNALDKGGRQIIKIGLFEVDDNGTKFTPITTISAHKFSNSTTYPMFIEPDQNLPAGGSDYAALYWVESSRKNGINKESSSTIAQEYAACYLVLNPLNKVISKGYLSVKDDKPRYWNIRSEGQGDYYTGGFFYAEDRLNFVPQWTEDDGIHANVITVKPEPSASLKIIKK